MYAIVEIAGQQFKVAKDQKVYVHRLREEEGTSVSFDKVLLVGDNGTITIGAPAIEGAEVTAKILGHLQGDKVIVFKKKRRKGFRKKNGHRQALTEIQIEGISASGAKKKEVAKKEAPKAKVAAPKAKKTTSKIEEVEVSDNLITRAENRVEESGVEINAEKLLHSIGTATKAEADDLKEINGIGPAFEEKLNEVGVYTYEQISKLKVDDRKELSAIDGITRDKIESEEWVKQAKALLKNKK
ncbi:MAG: 50S ribosomal protein L21 [Flavobacteriaceae bacterium]|nr:50S ribosomal protein L21 [Flavobacteriaceae bacterium]